MNFLFLQYKVINVLEVFWKWFWKFGNHFWMYRVFPTHFVLYASRPTIHHVWGGESTKEAIRKAYSIKRKTELYNLSSESQEKNTCLHHGNEQVEQFFLFWAWSHLLGGRKRCESRETAFEMDLKLKPERKQSRQTIPTRFPKRVARAVPNPFQAVSKPMWVRPQDVLHWFFWCTIWYSLKRCNGPIKEIIWQTSVLSENRSHIESLKRLLSIQSTDPIDIPRAKRAD